MEESALGKLPQPSPDTAKIVDIFAKVAVVFAAIIYGAGFLVISLHQYGYGLAGTNPFRPKVLAAGVWFFVFASAPFVLIGQARRVVVASPKHEEWLRSFSTRLFFACSSSYGLGVVLSGAFEGGMELGAKWPSTFTILIVLAVCAVLVFADLNMRFPRWIAVVASLAFGSLVTFCGLRDLAVLHRPSVASVALWFMGYSYFVSIEMAFREWEFKLGNWTQTVALGIAAVTGFASIYYPHIKPSWGGGSLVPATIYFTRDSLVSPGRSVSAKIIDETDGGFYIIGGDDKKATFIPRSAVAMLYYSDDASGPFIVKSK